MRDCCGVTHVGVHDLLQLPNQQVTIPVSFRLALVDIWMATAGATLLGTLELLNQHRTPVLAIQDGAEFC